MAIAEQFAGLQMDQLIGAPLRAAADASISLAESTATFINKVGFDNGKVRSVAFGYQKKSMNDDGTSNVDEMKIDVPMLAIVPIPNLQVDEVNVLFDMEVKQSEKEDTSLDMGASLTGSLQIGPVKVSVSGSVSSHSSNTRSSDNSAKYHVDVRAANHGIPEGLARVLDMMAANVAPALVGSTVKDGNGNDLSEQAKKKAEDLKAKREEISITERRQNAVKKILDSNISQLKKNADNQYRAYQMAMQKDLEKLQGDLETTEEAIKNATDADARSSLESKKSDYETKIDNLKGAMASFGQPWVDFQSRAKELVETVAGSGSTDDAVILDTFGFKKYAGNTDANNTFTFTIDTYASGEAYYNIMVATEQKALESQKQVNETEKELTQKQEEYNQLLAKK